MTTATTRSPHKRLSLFLACAYYTHMVMYLIQYSDLPYHTPCVVNGTHCTPYLLWCVVCTHVHILTYLYTVYISAFKGTMVLSMCVSHDLHVNFLGVCRCFHFGEVVRSATRAGASTSLVACCRNVSVKTIRAMQNPHSDCCYADNACQVLFDCQRAVRTQFLY